MTTETKKPSEAISELREEIAIQVMVTPSFELLSAVGQAHASATAIVHYLDAEHERRQAWENGVADKLVAQDQLLVKLLALNPEARDVVGVTASGATVHGLAPYPLCVDGSRVHDLKGQSSCPACGFTPKLATPHEPTAETEEP